MPINSPLPSDLAGECRKAANILRSFVKPGLPDKQIIPRAILGSAKGLAIYSNLKAGFLFSGRAGSGLVVARLPNGSWSAPTAMGTGGFGGGFQGGVELTDVVLILTSRTAVRQFMAAGSLTVGGNLSVAAGPVGRNAEGAGALNSKGKLAAIYSYSQTRGLFAGVSVEGSVILERSDANAKFYRQNVTAKQLLSGSIEPPDSCYALMSALEECCGGSAAVNQLRRGRSISDASPYNLPPEGWRDSSELGSRDSLSLDPFADSASTRSGRGNRPRGATVSEPQRNRFQNHFDSDFGDRDSDPTDDYGYPKRGQSPFEEGSTAPRSRFGMPRSSSSKSVSKGVVLGPRTGLDKYAPPAYGSPTPNSRSNSTSATPKYGFEAGQYQSPPARSSFDFESEDRAVNSEYVTSPRSKRTQSSYGRDQPSRDPFTQDAFDFKNFKDVFSESEQRERQGGPGTFSRGQSYSTPNRSNGRIEEESLEDYLQDSRYEKVVALYDFTAKESGDLSFRKGDVIVVIERSDSSEDWWTGRRAGKTGNFPGNYVERM